VGGFPEKLQKKLFLKKQTTYYVRPGFLSQANLILIQIKEQLARLIDRQPSNEDVLSYIMYPEVFLGLSKKL